jgi:hypothetical protein
MKKIVLVLAAFLAMFGVAFSTLDAMATDEEACKYATGDDKSLICANSSTSQDTLKAKIKNALNTVYFWTGIIAVIVIIIGGFRYSTSMGDPGKATKAKSTIIYGVVGLVIALLAFSIVLFIFDKLK